MRELIDKLRWKNYSTYDIYWYTTYYWTDLNTPLVIYNFGNTEKSNFDKDYFFYLHKKALSEALIEIDFWPYKEDRKN